jgi:hypothetical protein
MARPTLATIAWIEQSKVDNHRIRQGGGDEDQNGVGGRWHGVDRMDDRDQCGTSARAAQPGRWLAQ